MNMIEYAGIYLKNQSVEYVRIIPNVSDAVHSIRSHSKRIMPEPWCATRNFSGQGDWEGCATRALQ